MSLAKVTFRLLHQSRSTSYKHSGIAAIRCFSSEDGKSTGTTEWRKTQLDKLEKKFSEPSQQIENEEDLQPMWRNLEARVKHRRPRTIQEAGGKTGRANIRKTDEDFWLRQGLYDDEAPKKP